MKGGVGQQEAQTHEERRTENAPPISLKRNHPDSLLQGEGVSGLCWQGHQSSLLFLYGIVRFTVSRVEW